MKDRKYLITLTEDLVIAKTTGELTRNSNCSQWFEIELNNWVLPEGSSLYIQLSHLDEESGFSTVVGPLNMILDVESGRYLSLVPPEVVSIAGKWNYSVELRYNIGESYGKEIRTSEIAIADGDGKILYKTTTVRGPDILTGSQTEITVMTDKDDDVISTATVVSGSDGKGIITYNSLTSAVYAFEITDSVISPSATDSFTKETELLSAARVMADALMTGHTAEDVLDAARRAQDSAVNAALSESASEQAKVQAEQAQSASEQAAMQAALSESEATSQAEEAAQQAGIATEQAQTAVSEARTTTEQATNAASSATQASASEESAAKSAREAEAAKMTAEAHVQTAKEWADTAEYWSDVAKNWADYGIKINTDYSTVADLPNPGDSHFIYLIPNGSTGNNSYDEYIWADSKGAYEKIGTTEVDLTDYVAKSGSTMTGALKTPKINVDKIARKDADYIYIEPKTEFHSRATFDQGVKAEKIYVNKISDNKIDEDNSGIEITSPVDFNSEVRVANLLQTNRLKVSHIGAAVSGTEIQVAASLCGSGDTDIKGIDTITAKQIKLEGGDTKLFRTNEDGNQVLNLNGDKVVINSNLTTTKELKVQAGNYNYYARGFCADTPTIQYNETCKSGFYTHSWEAYDKCFVCGEGGDKAVIQYSYNDGWHMRVSNSGNETMNARWMDTQGGIYDKGQRVYSPNNKPELVYESDWATLTVAQTSLPSIDAGTIGIVGYTATSNLAMGIYLPSAGYYRYIYHVSNSYYNGDNTQVSDAGGGAKSGGTRVCTINGLGNGKRTCVTIIYYRVD